MLLKKLLFFICGDKYNHRQYPRKEINAVIKYRLHREKGEDNYEYAYCKNISFGGILVENLEKPFEVGTVLDMQLTVPGENTVLFFLGKIVHKETNESGKFDYGVKFINKTVEVKTKLIEFLAMLK